jgi:hypothetical protein
MIDRELTDEEKDYIYKESVENAISNIKKSEKYLALSRKDKRKFIRDMKKKYLISE